MYFTIVGKTRVSWAVPHHSMSMGQLWGALAPQGYNLYPTAGYVLAQLDNLFICGDLHVSTKFSLELRLVKVGRNALSMRFFARFFAHCTIIVRPIAYKSHSPPFLNRPHDLTPVSWVCDKRCRRSSASKFVRKKKNNNKHAA